MMTLPDAILVGAVLAAGGALADLRQVRVSLKEQGRRIGALEDKLSHEEGRRRGRSEAIEELARERR